MNLPIPLLPHFRFGRETPWAGDTLHRLYEKYALGNQIGESYDFSTLSGHESTAPDGTPLSALVSSPFLIKWVDAKDPMSVHIHTHHDEYLIVVQTDADAKIVTGLNPGVTAHNLESTLSQSLDKAFKTEALSAGDVIHIGAGIPHSLSGATCYQIQAADNESLRIFDWNRINARGQKRPLQFEKALSSIKPGNAARLTDKQNNRLIHTDDFDVYELTGCMERVFPVIQPFSVLTCLAQSIIKIGNSRTLYLCAGQTLLIPGNCSDFTLTGERFFLTTSHA